MIAGKTSSEKSVSRSGNSPRSAIHVEVDVLGVVGVRPHQEEEKIARPAAQPTAAKAPGALLALPTWREKRMRPAAFLVHERCQSRRGEEQEPGHCPGCVCEA